MKKFIAGMLFMHYLNKVFVPFWGPVIKEVAEQREKRLAEEKEDKPAHRPFIPRPASLDDVLFEDSENANQVVWGLRSAIKIHGQATIADFYQLCGVQPSFGDTRLGWSNLDNVDVKRTRGGFQIMLPEPSMI